MKWDAHVCEKQPAEEDFTTVPILDLRYHELQCSWHIASRIPDVNAIVGGITYETHTIVWRDTAH